jgi:hypothetical protein
MSALASTSLRLAGEVEDAIEARAERLDPILSIYRSAETEEERAAAAGELLSIAAVADEEYRRRVDRAIEHLICGDQEHVVTEGDR